MATKALTTAVQTEVIATRERLHAARLLLQAAVDEAPPGEREPLAAQVRLLDWLLALSRDLIVMAGDLVGGEERVAAMHRARWFETVGDVAEKWEEVFSRGDATFLQRAADTVSFVLGWLGDSSFVAGAETEYAQATLALQAQATDHLWACYEHCDEEPVTQDRVAAIRQGVAAVVEGLFAPALPPTTQRLALGALYLMLLSRGVQRFATLQAP